MAIHSQYPDRDNWLKISELAEYFDYSAIQMGDLLKFYGFRDSKGRATKKAKDLKYARSFQLSDRSTSSAVFWSKQAVLGFFIGKNHKLIKYIDL